MTSSERAIPKSVTFAWPSPFSSTFCGLTSRWTSPCSWAKPSARAIWSAEPHRVLLGQRPLALDERLQVLAGDVLEDDELAIVLLAAVDHRDDVRMRELRDRARLATEALDVVGRRR